MNRPTIAGMKYWSEIDITGSGDGVGVVAAESTEKLVSANDGQ